MTLIGPKKEKKRYEMSRHLNCHKKGSVKQERKCNLRPFTHG